MKAKPRKREEPVVLTKEDWLHIAALIGLFDESPGAMGLLHKIGLTGEIANRRGTKPARKGEGRKKA